ncbi:MAG: DUF421 domain-containing protein [Nocardioidaceae bacterium]
MDIVIRAALVFVVLGLVIRITGKRQIAQLSAFDLILIVTMGDLIGQTVLQEDYSLTAGLLAVLTFGVLSMVVGAAMYWLPRSRPVLRGQPTVFLRDGKPDQEVMRYELIHRDDLDEAAREAGIRDLADIDLAIMETDGTFSFFKRDDRDDESSERGSTKTV